MKQLLLIVSIALLAIGCSTVPDDGVHTTYYQNGQLRTEENYKDGVLHGLYKSWHEPDPPFSEGNYRDVKLDGLFREWWKNGQLKYEGNYKDGKLDGVIKQWYKNAQLQLEINYKDGVKISEKAWYENGNPKSITPRPNPPHN